MDSFKIALIYLIQTIFSLYLLVIYLRFFLQVTKASYYEPISQLTVKLTDYAVKPLRKVIPIYKGIDGATLVLLLLVETVKIILLSLVVAMAMPKLLGMLIWILGDLISLILNFYFFAIIMQVILSWLNPMQHSAMTAILFRISEPLLKPARRLIPPISGFDLSPIPVIIALQLLLIAVAYPLSDYGKFTAFL